VKTKSSGIASAIFSEKASPATTASEHSTASAIRSERRYRRRAVDVADAAAAELRQ
jgi:hypothetical protein